MREKIKLPTNRNFGIVFSIVFMLIALWPLINHNDIRVWSLILSLIFFILGLFNSKILNPLNKIWMKFGLLLGEIVAPIVMALVFFLIITPTGFILRILKKDVLKLKKNNEKTYWIKKEKVKNNMKKQY